jgi:hypothetical protein
MPLRWWGTGLTTLLVLVGVAREDRTLAAPPGAHAISVVNTHPLDVHARLPLTFELNEGQVDNRVRYLCRGAGYTLLLTPSGADLLVAEPRRQVTQSPMTMSFPPRVLLAPGLTVAGSSLTVRRQRQLVGEASVRLQFVSTNPHPQILGLARQVGKVNYFIGDNPRRWHTDIPTYGEVLYRDLYPGIDLAFYGKRGQPEYDWVVKPGANPSAIKLRVEGSRSGAQGLRIDRQGNLVVREGSGIIRQTRPVIYQTVSGARQVISARYVIQRRNDVHIALGRYDHTRTLTIDPGLRYSTFLTGGVGGQGNAIVADAAGDAYITGYTYNKFPTVNAVQSAYGGGDYDVFVVKLNAAGSERIYSTYVGGSDNDEGTGIALDSSGNAYVAGDTSSNNFPTVHPLQAAQGGKTNAFVAKLNAAGNGLEYSTYLGGKGDDEAGGVAADSAGNAYVAGTTTSADFPTAHALQPSYGGGKCSYGPCTDGFVAKLSPAGTALVYSTYLGGSSSDGANGIAVDSLGNAYITGSTTSSDFPTAAPFQSTYRAGTCNQPIPNQPCSDAFVTKLDPAGTQLVYSTYLGGVGETGASGIAVDATDHAYVTGGTASKDFPIVNAVQPTFGGHAYGDAFVSKFNLSGSALEYSTYLGGKDFDSADSVAVDRAGSAYVTGFTFSDNFPVRNAVQPARNSAEDAFVTKLSPAGNTLAYSTYLGGFQHDTGHGIAVDAAGNAYVTGETDSSDFPLYAPLDARRSQKYVDAFVAKVRASDPPNARPAITIDKVGILHRVKGKWVSTKSLQVNETGNFFAMARYSPPGYFSSAAIRFTISGKVIGHDSMDLHSTSDTKVVFYSEWHFTGTAPFHVITRITLKRGQAKATRSLSFTVTPK